MNGIENGNQRCGLDLCGTLVLLVCQAMATSVEVFLHRRFGTRYLGVQCVATIPLVLGFIAGWPEQDARPLLIFLWLYVAMCVLARTGIIMRGRRWDHLHSYYTGRPRIMCLFPRLSELTVKQYVEPVIVLGAAVVAFPANEALGAFLLFASFGLGVSVTSMRAADRMRAMDMNDAYLDQRHVAERFRDMRRDQF